MSLFDEHLPSEDLIREVQRFAAQRLLRHALGRCACLGPWLCVPHQEAFDRQFLSGLKLRWEA